MSVSSRVITRRQQLAMLSATTAAAVIGTTEPAEAQFWQSMIVRLVARVVLWGGAAYVVEEALSDHIPKKIEAADTTKKPDGKPASPKTKAETPADAAVAARRTEGDQTAGDAAKLASARAISDKLGLDIKWAQHIVDRHGLEVGRDVAAMKIAAWPLNESNARRIFDISLNNRTNAWQSGGMHINIRDIATNTVEFDYRFEGYRIAPYATLTRAVPFRPPFPSTGVKEITLRDQGMLVTPPTRIVVLPQDASPT